MTLSVCDECGEQAEVLYYPQFGARWLCEFCYKLYEREYGEPVPYPDTDEVMEDHRLV